MKYSIHNENCFGDINSISSYWLGFIAADGYIEKNTNLIGIGLNENDILHLEKFRDFLGSNHKIFYRRKTNSVVIRITNKKIKKDICCWIPEKLTRNTTGSLIKNIPDIYKRDFITGYFDGDGSVFTYTSKHKYKNVIYNNEYCGVNITANYNTLYDIKKYYEKYYNFKKLNIVKNGNVVYRISWNSNNDIIEFYNLYLQSPEHLERKITKYNNVIEKLKTNKTNKTN